MKPRRRRLSLVGLLPVVWFLTDWVVFTICLPILSPRLLRPSLNDWASPLGILTRNAVHRIRMFGGFMCVVCVFYAVLFASPNLRKNRNCSTITMKNRVLMFLSWGNPDKITYEDYAGKINDKKASTELTAEANILGYISMFTFSRVRNPGR